LHLGWCTVDFIGQKNIVKQGAGLKMEAPILRAEYLCPSQIRRQQIRCELNAVKVASQTTRERFDRGRFGESGGTLDQKMTIGKKRNKQTIDQPVLAENRLFDMLLQAHNTGMNRHDSKISLTSTIRSYLPDKHDTELSP